MSKKRRRVNRANTICTETAETASHVIDLSEAARIYRKITGRPKTPSYLAAELERYPYMTIFAQDVRGVCLEAIGVVLSRWVYFLNVRKALYGPRRVFDCYAPEEL